MELERLSDEDLTDEEIEVEIRRAKAITGVASQIVQTGNLVLNAAKFKDEKMNADEDLPRMLAGGE